MGINYSNSINLKIPVFRWLLPIARALPLNQYANPETVNRKAQPPDAPKAYGTIRNLKLLKPNALTP